MKNLLLITICILCLFSCGPKQEPKTIYIVRHAEKMLDGEDPLLSVAGTVRSKKLAEILNGKQISHIFSTNTVRTKATAQPLADQIQVDIDTYDADQHDEIVRKLRALKGNILVVGHSNTVHHLVNYFVEKEKHYQELDDIDYGYIFVVNMNKDGTAAVQRKMYKDF